MSYLRNLFIADPENPTLRARVNAAGEVSVKDFDSLAVNGAILSRLADKTQFTQVTDGTNNLNIDPTGAMPVIVNGSAFQPDFFTAVAMGLVPGYSRINKFGHNLAATSGDDVWGGGGVYPYFPTTAQIVEALSTSANDSAAGTGARTMEVYGLSPNWLPQNETVILNGLTPVALTKTYIRLFRAVVLTAGSTETNEGIVNVQVSGGGDIGIHISIGDGQTQHAIYTIPAGKTGYFIKGYVGLSDDNKSGETAQFQWQARPNNGTTGAWAVKGEMGLNNIGSSHWQYRYGIPAGPLPEKTDIRIRTILNTATLGVVGGYDLLLKDN